MNAVPYEGATQEQLRHPMVRELLAIHDMFRRELVQMLRAVESLLNKDQPLTGPEAQQQIQMLSRSGARYAWTLHMHHHIETSTLFPTLEREGLDPEIIQRLNSEHDEIAALVDSFEASVQRLAAVEPEVVNGDLRRLADALQAHLAYEETHVCPMLAAFSGWPLMR
jgi:hemerythrin-like domain-containing protein